MLFSWSVLLLLVVEASQLLLSTGTVLSLAQSTVNSQVYNTWQGSEHFQKYAVM